LNPCLVVVQLDIANDIVNGRKPCFIVSYAVKSVGINLGDYNFKNFDLMFIFIKV